MKRFWTADIHFSHGDAAVHSGRPCFRETDIVRNGDSWDWATPESCISVSQKADRFYIKNMNGRVKPDDMVIHNGDFLNRGVVKGHTGLRNKSDYYLNLLNGTWTLLEGNHDSSNSVKTIGRHLITNIGNYRVFVSHYPTDNDIQDKDLIEWVYKRCDFAICGHVHKAWKAKFLKTRYNKPFLNVNVGIDATRYLPLHDAEVIEIFEKEMKKCSQESR